MQNVCRDGKGRQADSNKQITERGDKPPERGKDMTTEAQKKAVREYSRRSRDKFKVMTLKLNREADKDIIDKLASVDNMQGYIKELIRKDMK